MNTIALGWGRPVTESLDGGWDWWTLAGAVGLFLLIETARRRPPLGLAIAVAAVGGLIVADLTEAFGVVPIWGLLVMYALTRNLRRSGGRSQV
jgi:hypothetical protein